MKVLLLQDWLRSGGTERQAIFLTRAFRGAGHEASLITFRPGGKLWDEARDVAPAALQGRDWGWDWFAPGLLRRVQEEKPDVLLAMGRMANCHLWRAARALRPGAKAVATFRTGKPLPAWFRRSLGRADLVVANSQEAAENLHRHYRVREDKILTIYNALIFPAEAPARPARRNTIFACVAMFRPEKNQRELIQTFAGLPRDRPWELWLAGEGITRPECENLARNHGLADRVKFPGFQKDPASIYDRADVAVHASYSEALSNFLIEAQAHGLPAVAYKAQGIAECFLPGETGWEIPRGDAAAFRSAVVRLLDASPEARAAASARAAAFARERFDPARQTEAYLQAFERLLRS